MTAWILDDGPLDDLARNVTAEEARTWPKGQLFIVRQTATDADGRRLSLTADRETPLAVLDIPLESEAANIVYTHLRRQAGGTANLAEHQAIAWILTASIDAVFVTEDKRAALTALAELGCGRVAHAFDLWLHLADEGMITFDQLRSLSESVSRKDQGLPGVALRIRQKLTSASCGTRDEDGPSSPAE